MHIDKIQKKRVHEQIVHKIEEMLLSRELKVGDRLPSERDLARKFNVSRNAVRQALAILKEKELIEIRIGDGTYAKSTPEIPVVSSLADLLNVRRKEIIDPIEVRQLLEPQIASLAEEDEEFHCKIAILSGNSILPKILTSTFIHVDESRLISLSNKRSPRLSLDDHQKIVNAIRMRDSEGAYEAMYNHLENIRKFIISKYVEQK
jgi:DNA-binding FadR family transcriptional regulator